MEAKNAIRKIQTKGLQFLQTTRPGPIVPPETPLRIPPSATALLLRRKALLTCR